MAFKIEKQLNYSIQKGENQMDIAKVLEVLNVHILKLESDIYLKDYEINKLKEKLTSIEEHIDSYYGGNYEKE